jgi:hypothetical protein
VPTATEDELVLDGAAAAPDDAVDGSGSGSVDVDAAADTDFDAETGVDPDADVGVDVDADTDAAVTTATDDCCGTAAVGPGDAASPAAGLRYAVCGERGRSFLRA